MKVTEFCFREQHRERQLVFSPLLPKSGPMLGRVNMFRLAGAAAASVGDIYKCEQQPALSGLHPLLVSMLFVFLGFCGASTSTHVPRTHTPCWQYAFQAIRVLDCPYVAFMSLSAAFPKAGGSLVLFLRSCWAGLQLEQL